jgi:glycosyltransferase involved in cell wall biosynthesis
MTTVERPISALHVVAGLELSDGGPSYSIPGLCRSLAAAGTVVTLLSVTRGSVPTSMGELNFLDRRFPAYGGLCPLLNRLRFSPGLTKELDVDASQTDIVHNHGLWLMPNVQAAWAAARHKKPLIVAPRGMLNPAALGFSGIRKKLFWHLLQKAPVQAAACLHVTSLQEYNEVRGFGLTNPVAIIPNGIDIPDVPARPSEERRMRVALSFGRIHPKKGLDRLIRAWAKIESANPRWQLRIVGPSERGHDEELRSLAYALQLTRVSIEGPVYGPSKYELYGTSDLFILPTLGENFAMTVAEALASGIPVISTKGAPWSGLELERCGWWIDHGVGPLSATLACAMALPPEILSAMGARGREWMVRDFGWDVIGRKMRQVYAWTRGEANLPAWMVLG